MSNLYDIKKIRSDFPQLTIKLKKNPLIYLDSAATTLKPKEVIDKLSDLYLFKTANIHRAAHELSQNLSTDYETARENVANFINAKQNEVIFTKGTTESINFVAQSYAKYFSKGSEIIISSLEHHSNILPWQNIAKEYGLVLKFIKCLPSGELDFNHFTSLISKKTKLLALTICSNALGIINPVKDYINVAKKNKIKILLDAAQSISSNITDVKKLDADFLVFSGHKIFAPTGIGVLWVKENLLETLKPYQVGGGMISSVDKNSYALACAPYRFEAGTPPIVQAISLGHALNYVKNIGLQNIHDYEKSLLTALDEGLSKIDGVKIIGPLKSRVNICSFTVEGVHSSDIGQLLSVQGICVRTGNHCAQPLVVEELGINTGLTRISLSIYNNLEEVVACVDSVKKCLEMLR
ncbi:MAG: cysteine desulfurase [Bdellovibrionales bacterium]|nr:cysteine desulfurase [Bdellovibrionales bacterium]